MQAVAGVAKAATLTMATAGTSTQDYAGPKMSRCIMKQRTFNWSAIDKYKEL